MPADSLTRIADALVRIAEHLEATPQEKPRQETAFPWGRVSKRIRISISRYRSAESSARELPWPWTCEALFAVGNERLRETKGFGPMASIEIDSKLKELGFNDWMVT